MRKFTLIRKKFRKRKCRYNSFIKNHSKDILLVDDFIFEDSNKNLSDDFVKLMQSELEMNIMSELKYFVN